MIINVALLIIYPTLHQKNRHLFVKCIPDTIPQFIEEFLTILYTIFVGEGYQ